MNIRDTVLVLVVAYNTSFTCVSICISICYSIRIITIYDQLASTFGEPGFDPRRDTITAAGDGEGGGDGARTTCGTSGEELGPNSADPG